MAEANGDVFQWLKSMPLAPEYRPTLTEFQDPIAYIFKIEKEASKYGICKIIPPFPPPPRKVAIANFTRSLTKPDEPNSKPTFTTRQQQIGFCPRRPRPVQRPVWQSGENYTFQEFEAKAKAFEKSYLKKHHLHHQGHRKGGGGGGGSGGLGPLEVETLFWKATVDKPFSVEYANDMPGSAFSRKCREECAAALAESAWNMREISRANGSLLRFMKEEIPGVTSPMVYLAMLFSWFAWHVEDHDLHSLNYLHMGSGKTWYGVPRDAAVAFEDVVRVHGYGSEINPLVTFSTLGEKNTVMSPEVLINAGVPCCRIPESITAEPRSSRLKDKKRGEGETVIKELFVQDVSQNNDLLQELSKGSEIILLPRSSFDISLCSKLRSGSKQRKVNSRFSLGACNSEEMNSSKGFVSDDLAFSMNRGIKQEGSLSIKDKITSLCERSMISSYDVNGNICSSSSKQLQGDNERESGEGDGSPDKRLFSCVTCGILCFPCVAIVQPRESAARYLMSADCSFFNDWVVGSGVSSKKFIAHEEAAFPEPRWTEKKTQGLYQDPVQSAQYQLQTAERNYEESLGKSNTALALLASTYGNSSDSEEEHGDSDIVVDGHESPMINATLGGSPSNFQDGCTIPLTGPDSRNDFSHQSFDHSLEKQDCDTSSGFALKNMRAMYTNDTEKTLLGKAMVPNDDKNASVMPQGDQDSSRMHVFCLEHAVEAEQQLRPIGGAHIMLLCHPDFPKIEAEAKLVAEDLGIDYLWKKIEYRHSSKEDEERIQVALDSEEAIPGNGDWCVKLGINLFYSSTLSRSPLYSKQMPYNSVIYYAFGQSSPASSPLEPKVYQRRVNKQKKIVAGKWCGKVWMSSQVHPLLAKRDSEDVEDEKSLHGWGLHDEKIERSGSIPKSETSARKSGKKRKMTIENGRARKGSFAERDVDLDNPTEDKPNQQLRRTLRSKQARDIESEGADLEGDYSPPYHRKPLSDQTNCTGSDAVSDDSLDDKFIDNDVVSDDTMVYDSDCHQRFEHSSMQVEDIEDAVSEDSLDDGSLQLHRKNSKSKHARYIRKGRCIAEKEEMMSDDQLEPHKKNKQQRNPKSRQAKYLAREDAISHGQLEGHCRKYRKTPKGRLAKYVAGEDVSSDEQLENYSRKQQTSLPKRQTNKGVLTDDQLEDHFQKQQKSVSRRRQNKGIERGVKDEMSDDQLEDHVQKQQTSVSKRRRNKQIERDDVMSDDEMEDHFQKQRSSIPRNRQNSNSHLAHKTPKRKQAKCVDDDDGDDDDVNSDDEVEDDSQQKQQRTLRSKQSKPMTLKQMKQARSLQMKNQTSRSVKRGAQTLKKLKASQIRNKQSGKSREFSLKMEEGEEGGPSTRLRKRAPKVEESDGISKEKQTKKKRVKNATSAKAASNAKVKDEENEFQCDIDGCTMSFGSKQELMHHKRNICPVKGCGKKFFSHKYLVQHRRVHEDDRPLKCPWKGCKMTFKWAWARTEHIRVHTGARPYVCAEPGCGQTFRFVSDFSRHKRKTGHSTKKSR
ncbi:Lysine-specific demethylase [Arachis hypogaea]|nr:Lysine-specific demethylase [Arachis hypogaea]